MEFRKLIELKETRGNLHSELSAIAKKAADEDRTKTAEEKARFEEIKKELKSLDDKIENATYALQNTPTNIVEGEVKSATNLDGLRKLIKGEAKACELPDLKLKAADLNSTTDANLTPHSVAKGADLVSDSAGFLLSTLGIEFVPNAVGQVKRYYNNVNAASMPGEGEDASVASFTRGSIVLTPQPFSHDYTISDEGQASFGDDVVADVLNKLVDGLWKKVEAHYWDQFVVDASGRGIALGDPSTHFQNALNLEAAADGRVFVAPKTLSKYIKGSRVDNGSGRLVWENGKMLSEYPAYSREYANTGELIFFDPKATTIAQFGPVKIIKDEVSRASKREITFTATVLADAGVNNPYLVAFSEGTTALD